MFWRSLSCVRRFHASSDPGEGRPRVTKAASDWPDSDNGALSLAAVTPHMRHRLVTEEDPNNNNSLTQITV